MKKLTEQKIDRLDGVIHSTSKTFESDVLSSRVPVVVDFFADWCGPCRMVAPIIEELAQEFGSRVRFVKVNVDENPDLADKYGVSGIPTVILFKGKEEVSRLTGAAPKEYYRHSIDQNLLN